MDARWCVVGISGAPGAIHSPLQAESARRDSGSSFMTHLFDPDYSEASR